MGLSYSSNKRQPIKVDKQKREVFSSRYDHGIHSYHFYAPDFNGHDNDARTFAELIDRRKLLRLWPWYVL